MNGIQRGINRIPSFFLDWIYLFPNKLRYITGHSFTHLTKSHIFAKNFDHACFKTVDLLHHFNIFSP